MLNFGFAVSGLGCPAFRDLGLTALFVSELRVKGFLGPTSHVVPVECLFKEAKGGLRSYRLSGTQKAAHKHKHFIGISLPYWASL